MTRAVTNIVCRICKVNKSSDNFHKSHTKSKTGHQSFCKQCFREYRVKNRLQRNAYARSWTARNKEKVRNNRIMNKYKISPADFNSRIVAQLGKCLICFSVFSEVKKPVIDHNHSNNKVRGILCNGCNYALGIFQDSTNRLQRAIEYLQNEGVMNL